MANLLSICEAAKHLGITERGLRARVARHQIPFRRWNGRIVFVVDELDDFVRRLPGCDITEALERAGGRS